MNEEEPDFDAGPGRIWVCSACGKISKNRMGSSGPSSGWDASCFLNAVLCYLNKSRAGTWEAVLDKVSVTPREESEKK